MTAIISSRIVYDRVQRDGRRCIREEHTDDAGQVHAFDYLAAADFDAHAQLSMRAAALGPELTALIEKKAAEDAEIERIRALAGEDA